MRQENHPFNNEDENHKTTTGVPHSGVHWGEYPVREFSKSLEDAAEQDIDKDFETPFDGFENDGQPDDEERDGWREGRQKVRESFIEPEVKKSRKKLIFGSVAGAVLLGTATVVGINATTGDKNEAPTTPTEPGNEAPIVPGESVAPTDTPVTPEITPSPTDIPATFEATPTPTVAEKPSPTAETEKGSEYTYAELTAMSKDKMVNLPIDDRLVFAQGVYNYFTEWNTIDFGEDVDEMMGRKNDSSDIYKFNPVLAASPDNTPEEIAKQIIYTKQANLIMKENFSMGGSFNLDAAAKLASTIYINPEFANDASKDSSADTTMYEMAMTNFKGITGLDTHFPQEITSFNKAESSVEEITDKDGETRHIANLKYSLTFEEDAGYLYRLEGGVAEVTFTQKAIYHQPAGSDKGMWLLIEDNSFGVTK